MRVLPGSVLLGALLLGCAAPPAPTVGIPQASPGEPPPGPAPRPPPPAAAPPSVVRLGGGCEAVREAYVEEVSRGGPPDLTAGAFGAVLNKGSYLNACQTPSNMTVQICAAILDGHATGVTVKTTPGDEPVATCIATAVQGMAFPASPKLDVTTTVFAGE